MWTDLDELRGRLDTIDEGVITLLSEGARIVDQAAAVQQERKISVYIPACEASNI
jgi:chorismate mutase